MKSEKKNNREVRLWKCHRVMITKPVSGFAAHHRQKKEHSRETEREKKRKKKKMWWLLQVYSYDQMICVVSVKFEVLHVTSCLLLDGWGRCFIRVCVCERGYACVLACTHVCVGVCVCACVYVYACAHVFVFVWPHVYICRCLHVYTICFFCVASVVEDGSLQKTTETRKTEEQV